MGETDERAMARRRATPRLLSIVACGWLLVVVLSALLAHLLAPQGYNAQAVTAALRGPSAAHPLGTDELGRGLLTRIVYGARPAAVGVIIVVAVASLVGVPAGLAGGYRRGILDRGFTGVADLLQSVPGLLLLLVAATVFGNNLYPGMIIFGLVSAAPMYRVVRAATLTVGGELYVTAARTFGLTDAAIIRHHLLPRLAQVVRVQVALTGAVALLMEVSLGFLGLDTTPPAPSWGGMIADAAQFITDKPWMLIPPAGAICLTVLALGFLGDATDNRNLRLPRGQRPASPRRGRIRSSPLAADGGERAPETASSDSKAAVDVLTIEDLTVTTRSGVDLVDHVSLSLRAGEVVGLVGESGSGKSVTVRAVLQLDDTMVTGRIAFKRRDIMSDGRYALQGVRGKGIAYIGQDPMTALHPLFKVESLLTDAIRSHHPDLSRREARSRVPDLLRSVGIPQPEVVMKQRGTELSGGLAQRVAIALALAGDPDVLIADEPTTALDVSVQMEVLGVLKRLQHDRQLAVILVTHDWGVVADMCDRAVTLYAGEVVEVGSVESVFARPLHPYTAALRHADPHSQKPGSALRSISGTLPPPGERPDFCRFAARCPVVIDACKAHHPELVGTDSTTVHLSRCLRVDELKKD